MTREAEEMSANYVDNHVAYFLLRDTCIYIMAWRGQPLHPQTKTAQCRCQENVTNETELAIEVLSCTQAVDAWCHSDPSSAPCMKLLDDYVQERSHMLDYSS